MSEEPNSDEWRMTEETLPKRPGAGQWFHWRQFCIALALFPLSFALWVICLESQTISLESPLFFAPPLLAIAGVIWTMAVVALHFWPRRR